MPIANIVDHRKRQYRFQKVNAIVEATWHDNSCKDADQIGPARAGPDYDEREHLSVAAAVDWASRFPEPVTLFLYDEDDGIYVSKSTSASDVSGRSGTNQPASPTGQEK